MSEHLIPFTPFHFHLTEWTIPTDVNKPGLLSGDRSHLLKLNLCCKERSDIAVWEDKFRRQDHKRLALYRDAFRCEFRFNAEWSTSGT